VFQRSHLTNFFSLRDQLNTIGSELWAVGEWWSLVQSQKGPVQVGGYWSEIYVREGDVWKIRISIFNVTPPENFSPAPPTLAQRANGQAKSMVRR